MQVQEVTQRLLPIARASRKASAGKETIEVSTVDGFQGREKEVLVISTVRCNGQGRLGFLKDHRRMNVAFTRARRGMVVIGSAHTLRTNRLWAAWLFWVRSAGAASKVLLEDAL
jgi:superfamily I DNA and/or RNA helicase